MKLSSAVYHRTVVLKECDMSFAGASCPVCSATSRRCIGTIQKTPRVDLLLCDECGTGAASHMPLPHVLDDYYANYYPMGNEVKATVPNVTRFAKHILKLLKGDIELHSCEPLRILDFGGGDGSLCVELAAQLPRPVRASVIDYAQPRSHSVLTLDLAHHTSLEELTGTYDLVIASASLEHVPNMRGVLSKLLSLLPQRGGWFYARTPWIAPFMKFPGVDFTFPAHLYDLGPPFWNRAIKTFRMNGQIIVSKPSIVETPFTAYPLRTTAAYALKSLGWLEASLRKGSVHVLWPFVGGWEIMIRINP